MSRYNPFNWFREKPEIVLYCNNCGKPVEKKIDRVAFYKKGGEIYHLGQCANLAQTDKATREGRIVTQASIIDYISLGRARQLFRKGELRQTSKLEVETVA